MTDRMTLNYNAIELRKKFGEDENSYIDVFNLISNCENTTLLFYPMSSGISGMCIKDSGNMVIAVNSTLSRGRQRFTIAHELCHLYYHDSDSCYVCGYKNNSTGAKEKEADMFASYFLAPYNAFKSYVDNLAKESRQIGLQEIIKCEQRFGLSHLATLCRLRQEGYIKAEEFEKYQAISPAPIARAMGYNSELYAPISEEQRKYTTGKYIKLANDLNEKELVSTSKYEELLLEAFRADLVFGEGGDGDID